MLRRFSLAWVSPFPLRVPQYPNRKLVSSPRRVKPSRLFSSTGLSCLLRVKGYGAYSAGRRQALAQLTR
jgi:hypothetical protein